MFNVILDINNKMSKETEALLYAASRTEHLYAKVIPHVNDGYIVLSDRYIDSSLAYQGYARGLGMESVLRINHFALKNLPDVTFFIDVTPDVALKRLSNRNKSDRLDLETMKFHEDVYKGYLEVCKMYPERVVRIDGNRSLEVIIDDIINRVLEIIG